MGKVSSMLKTGPLLLATIGLLALACSDDPPGGGPNGHAGADGSTGTGGNNPDDDSGVVRSDASTGSGGGAYADDGPSNGRDSEILTGLPGVYVSPRGDDKNPGTEAEPVRTLERARDIVRPMVASMQDDVHVYLSDGTHRLTKAFEL